MIYLPACFVIVLLIAFQILTGGIIPRKIPAYIINQYGEYYPLQPIMCIGGTYAEINMLESELEKHHDIPNVVEIRYENEEYIIKNMEKNCNVTIKRGTRFFTVQPEKELVLCNKDDVMVTYGGLSIHYNFLRG